MKQRRGTGVLVAVGDRPSTETEMTVISDTFWQSTYRQHAPSLLAFLSSRIGRRDLAEDLLQETFVRAMRAQEKLRDTSKIRSYLFSTAHRLVLNQFRRKRPVLFSEINAEARIDREDERAEAPDEAADLSLAEERLRAVVEEMSPALRTAFRAAIYEHKSYSEIASENGWTEGQVRVNVCRARKHAIKALRDLLSLEGVS